ncbi:MAG: hypothetical protein U0172_12920 [Nitrospiraceae bacterium]
MQSLDVNRPGMEDLQFVLVVAALCTSDIETLNVPMAVRTQLFDRCWALLHEEPPPTDSALRRLDVRMGTEVTLQALVATIRETLGEAGIDRLTWDHPPSPPTMPTSPQAAPLVDRLKWFDPGDPAGPASSASN